MSTPPDPLSLQREVREVAGRMELVDRGYQQRMDTLARRLGKLQELEQRMDELERKLATHDHFPGDM